jgi:hypothetical protein
MTYLLAITLAGAVLFPDANNIKYDTADDCTETAQLVVLIHQAPVEATCYESPDGRKLGAVVQTFSRR